MPSKRKIRLSLTGSLVTGVRRIDFMGRVERKTLIRHFPDRRNALARSLSSAANAAQYALLLRPMDAIVGGLWRFNAFD